MDRIIQSPGKYIQGADVINRLGEYLKPLAERWLVVGDKFVLGFAQSTVEKSFKDAGLVVEIAPFGGECSQNEIDRLRGIAETAQCGAILGIGGGKTLDTAKALAHFMGVPVAIAPTIASTDAPCSALSVIYTDEGEFDRYLLLPNNPNMVIVDTKIVAGAPARLLAAGIGDALATWFEARACSRSGATTMAGGKCTQAALALADAAGLPRASSLKALTTFTGLPHRFEVVLEHNGVRWINDSKATNVGSTEAALNGLHVDGTLHLLLGGDGKSADFSPLARYLNGDNVRLYCFGRDGAQLAALRPEVAEQTETMEQAMRLLAPRVQPGDMVLLSPACASLDQFKNFEQRGNEFARLAKELG